MDAGAVGGQGQRSALPWAGVGGALGEGTAGLGPEVQLAGQSSREREPERRISVDSSADTKLRNSDSWGDWRRAGGGDAGYRSCVDCFELEP